LVGVPVTWSGVAVRVAVRVAVFVGVLDGVLVEVAVLVAVLVAVFVGVAVGVSVFVGVVVGVGVFVTSGDDPPADVVCAPLLQLPDTPSQESRHASVAVSFSGFGSLSSTL